MQIKKGFFLHEIGKETIVMHDGSDNINFCNVISLNPTAAFLWRQIEGRAFTACTLAINYEGTLEEMMGIEFALGGHFGVGTSFTLQGEPLTDAELPESVKAIPAYAFSSMRDLQTVTIGESLTAIGTQAFYHCTALTEITYGGSKEEWLALEKGDDWNTYYDSESGDSAVLPLTVYCSDGAIAYGEQAEDEAAV